MCLRYFVLVFLFIPMVCSAEVGTRENPIFCDDVQGERWYLSRLRTLDYERLTWSRRGSTGGNKTHGHILDHYESEQGHSLLLDMYHPNYVDIRCPPGFRLMTEYSNDYEYIQGIIHAVGDENPYTGDILVRHRDGGDRYRCRVVDGLIQGALDEFYEDGNLRCRRLYAGKNNQRNGPETWYWPNGQLWISLTFVDGATEGEVLVYFEDGALKLRSHYVNGQKNGERIEYFPDGTIKAKGTLVDGRWKGRFIEYFEDGSVKQDRVIE